MLRTVHAWRMERRTKPGGVIRYRIGSVTIGVAVSTAFALLVAGADTNQFFNGLWNSTVGTSFGLSHTLALTAVLLLTGLAAALPLRIGLWNIGGDGQLFLGAWGAYAVGTLFPQMNAAGLVPLMFVAGAACGAAWSIIPALARAYLNVNEIISTLMFNLIAGSWVIYWAGTKWAEPQSAGSIQSRPIPKQSALGSISIDTYLIPIGFIVAVGLALAIWIFLRGSLFGYQMSIIGANPRAARYAGMRVRGVMVAVFTFSGAAAGLAGVVGLLGEIHSYGPSLSNNLGYTGVVVAALAGGLGLELIAMAALFAVISVAGNVLTITGAPSELVYAMYGLTLICAAIGQGIRHVRIVRPRQAEGQGVPTAEGAA